MPLWRRILAALSSLSSSVSILPLSYFAPIIILYQLVHPASIYPTIICLLLYICLIMLNFTRNLSISFLPCLVLSFSAVIISHLPVISHCNLTGYLLHLNQWLLFFFSILLYIVHLSLAAFSLHQIFAFLGIGRLFVSSLQWNDIFSVISTFSLYFILLLRNPSSFFWLNSCHTALFLIISYLICLNFSCF